MNKLCIGILYGGKSTEHEVSIHSAAYVCEVLAKKYNIVRIFISRSGEWFLQQTCGEQNESDIPLSPIMAKEHNLVCSDGKTFKIDVFFPVLHGSMGEDGTIQGFFEIMGVPYVGCGVLTSALGMDKEICKILASLCGVDTVPYIRFEKEKSLDINKIETAVKGFGLPIFVKPISLGSSIGVTRVDDLKDLPAAIDNAFKYEGSILIEKGIDNAREVFCGVIGTDKEIYTSLCGELKILNSNFFDYKAKYEDPHGCDIECPALIPQEMQGKMRSDCGVIFKILRGSGFARIDFLLDTDGKYYFSEINTLPGMSATSLFPQLWQETGKKYEDVLDLLIKTAFDRKEKNESFSIER